VGGIFNDASLTLNATTVTQNTATGPGGGIFNLGILTVNAGSSITGNTPDQCFNIGSGTGCP
jgi:hypothetical protein